MATKLRAFPRRAFTVRDYALHADIGVTVARAVIITAVSDGTLRVTDKVRRTGGRPAALYARA